MTRNWQDHGNATTTEKSGDDATVEAEGACVHLSFHQPTGVASFKKQGLLRHGCSCVKSTLNISKAQLHVLSGSIRGGSRHGHVSYNGRYLRKSTRMTEVPQTAQITLPERAVGSNDLSTLAALDVTAASAAAQGVATATLQICLGNRCICVVLCTSVGATQAGRDAAIVKQNITTQEVQGPARFPLADGDSMVHFPIKRKHWMAHTCDTPVAFRKILQKSLLQR